MGNACSASNLSSAGKSGRFASGKHRGIGIHRCGVGEPLVAAQRLARGRLQKRNPFSRFAAAGVVAVVEVVVIVIVVIQVNFDC